MLFFSLIAKGGKLLKQPKRIMLHEVTPRHTESKSVASRAMKISVIGIGTELTSGQILNRNAQWISRKLAHMGLQSSSHIVVPDDKMLILDALSFAAKNSEILFVTGGLGPTTDDFTRDVIAEFTHKKLIYDEASWQYIEARLQARGVPVREAQRQQCYYPETAQILTNSMGTAHGFFLKHEDLQIYVLPGPPREIEAIWNDHIQTQIHELCKTLNLYKTLIWQTLGLGESEIANMTEKVLEGCDLEKGYRAHQPYTEVKLSYYRNNETEALAWADKVTSVLQLYLVARDDEDVTELLSKKLEKFNSIVIKDSLSGFHILNRLTPALKNILAAKKIQYLNALNSSISAELELELYEGKDNSAICSIKFNGTLETETFQSPYKGTLLKERSPQYFTEKAFFFWLKNI